MIKDNDETAADQESHCADFTVLAVLPAASGSLSSLSSVPKKFPPVAKPWLAEIETEMVMAAVKDTIWRYCENGGGFAAEIKSARLLYVAPFVAGGGCGC